MTRRALPVTLPLALALAGCSSDPEATGSAASASSTGSGGAPATSSTTTATTGGAAGAGGGGGTGGMIDDDAPFAEKRAACAFKAGAKTDETFGPSIAQAQIPIDTFVLVVQENRSFDHYLSALPAYGQPDVDVAAPDATSPDADGNPVSRFHQTNYCFGDTNHGWDGMHVAWNGGGNDGFVEANDPGGERALGWFDDGDLPFYYAAASAFGVGDRYFCPTLTQTGPNRLYLYGGTSLGSITNVGGPAGFVSIFDSLNDAGVAWGVYRNASYSYEGAMFPAQATMYPERFKSLTDFAADAAADALPAVVFTYVGPDEHPPQDMQKGAVEVQKKIFAPLSTSPAWMHAAMIVTYDESGGLYDHVPPPKACAPDDIPPDLNPGQQPGGFDQYGFRVPFIVASAWSRPHFVSHTVHDHTSILRLLELRFGLSALTARDANANSLLEFFDFSSPGFPQPPDIPLATVDAAKLCP